MARCRPRCSPRAAAAARVIYNPSALAGRHHRSVEEHGQHSADRHQGTTAIASRCWSRAMSISGRSMSCAPSRAPRADGRAAAESIGAGADPACAAAAARATRGHGAVHQPAAERPLSRRAQGWQREALPFADFDWCRRLRSWSPTPRASASMRRRRSCRPRCLAASASRSCCRRPPAPVLSSHHDPPPSRAGLVDRGTGARGASSSARGARRDALDDDRAAAAALLATGDYEAFMRLAVRRRARTSWSPGRPAPARPPGPRR